MKISWALEYVQSNRSEWINGFGLMVVFSQIIGVISGVQNQPLNGEREMVWDIYIYIL